MIKWIGQHIVDFIARFRSDVYLEDIADGTVVDNKFLGLDSNNKIVKEAASATVTDLHSAGVDGSANQLLTDDGDGTITSESTLTYDSETLTIGADDDGVAMIKRKPHSDGLGGQLRILGGNATAGQTDTAGNGLRLFGGQGTGTGVGGHVEINTFPPAASTGTTLNSSANTWDFGDDGLTTIPGALTTGTTAFVNSSGVVQVATQGTIDHDSLANFVAAEHYDWSSDISGTATVHANNITDLHGAGVDGAANQLLTDDGDGSVSSEALLTWDGSTTLTLGSDATAIMNIKRHAMATANGSDLHLFGGDATDGQTNLAGGDLKLQSGLGTGTGARGKIDFLSGKTESSGTDLQSATFAAQFADGVFENTTGYGFREKINFVTDTFEDVLADGDHTGSKVLVYGADETLADGQIFFLHTDGTWDQADASAVATGASQLLGVGNGRTVSSGVILEGFIRIPSTEILNTPGSGAVDGLPVYVSTTAGHFDFTAPSGNNEFVRVVGYAIDDDSSDVLVYFNPDSTYVKITA
tara:strand:+ start:203 stop:1783 length:1581 start_codon:yes stop_codon:yes gene_type:complete